MLLQVAPRLCLSACAWHGCPIYGCFVYHDSSNCLKAGRFHGSDNKKRSNRWWGNQLYILTVAFLRDQFKRFGLKDGCPFVWAAQSTVIFSPWNANAGYTLVGSDPVSLGHLPASGISNSNHCKLPLGSKKLSSAPYYNKNTKFLCLMIFTQRSSVLSPLTVSCRFEVTVRKSRLQRLPSVGGLEQTVVMFLF